MAHQPKMDGGQLPVALAKPGSAWERRCDQPIGQVRTGFKTDRCGLA